MTPHFRLFRMKARHWHWRRHFLVSLFCFAFGVGIAGDIRWLQSEPEIARVEIDELLAPSLTASEVTLYAPASVTGYAVIVPTTADAGKCLQYKAGVYDWGDCEGGLGSGTVTSSAVSTGVITATALSASTVTALLAADHSFVEDSLPQPTPSHIKRK